MPNPNELQNRIASLEAEIDALKKQKAQDDYAWEDKERFLVTKKAMASVSSRNEELSRLAEGFAKAKEEATSLLGKVEAIHDASKKASSLLRELYFKARDNKIDEAFALTLAMEEIINEQKESAPVFASTLEEIKGYSEAYLYRRKYESGQMDTGLARRYVDLCLNLPTRLHNEKEKQALLYRAYAAYYQAVVIEEKEKPHDLTTLKAFSEIEIEAKKVGEEASPTLRNAIKKVHEAFASEYNELANRYFLEERNYEKAKGVYLLSLLLMPNEIGLEAYRSPDEESFRLAYLLEGAVMKDDIQFVEDLHQLEKRTSLKEEDGIIFASVLSCPRISDSKAQSVFNLFDSLDFEKQVVLLGHCCRGEISEPRKHELYLRLCRNKKKGGNLEVMAKDLLLLQENCPENHKNEFEKILKGLIRGPHAHKIGVKSTSKAVHSLYGENEENFRAPIGKPMKKTQVKYLSKGAMAGIIIGFIAAILVVLAAPTLLFRFLGGLDPIYLSVIEGGSSLLLFFVLASFMFARFGRDERGSALFRRLVGIHCFIMAAASLTVFLLPEQIGAYYIYGLGSLMGAGSVGLLSFLLFKDKKKRWSYSIYVPLALVLIAAIVFLALGLSKGAF